MRTEQARKVASLWRSVLGFCKQVGARKPWSKRSISYSSSFQVSATSFFQVSSFQAEAAAVFSILLALLCITIAMTLLVCVSYSQPLRCLTNTPFQFDTTTLVISLHGRSPNPPRRHCLK